MIEEKVFFMKEKSGFLKLRESGIFHIFSYSPFFVTFIIFIFNSYFLLNQ